MSMSIDEMKCAVGAQLTERYEVVKDHPSKHQFVRHLQGEKRGQPVHWPTEGLQVCHEAEKLLSDGLFRYRTKLFAVVNGKSWLENNGEKSGIWMLVSATYEQRLEALCRIWLPERFN